MKSSWSKRNKLYHRIVSVQWFDFEALLRKYLFSSFNFVPDIIQLPFNRHSGWLKVAGVLRYDVLLGDNFNATLQNPCYCPLLLLFSIYHLHLIEAIVEGMYNKARSYRFQCKMSKNTTHLTTILNHFICIWI